jgi:cytoskeletal protein RodZ
MKLSKKLVALGLAAALSVSGFAVSYASGSKTNNSGSSSHSSSSSSSSSYSGSTTTTSTVNGATVTYTQATVTVGGKTVPVGTATTKTPDGASVLMVATTGSVAGAKFAGVGTVTADGSAVVSADGKTTIAVSTAPILVITKDGVSLGCFVDPTTGKPVATGYTTMFYALGADGQLHLHFVNGQGFFLTGVQTVNGQVYNFDAQGQVIA